VEAGDKFCSNCGAVLDASAAVAPVEAAPAPPPPPLPPVGPRLEIAASGAEIPLPVLDEILIGREDPISGIYPNVDLTPHGGEEGGVSRQHARLFYEGGQYFVEDLDSTNYTFVNQQKLAPKTRHPLNDGDEIRCGRVALVLKTS
jgi:pSer/pThr/pTyr-binding forkhead associated (FHA) protein